MDRRLVDAGARLGCDDHASAPLLAGENFQLVPLRKMDVVPLYQFCLNDPGSFSWQFLGRTPSFEKFAAAIGEGSVAQLVVTPGVGGQPADPLALLSAVNASVRDAHAFIAVSTDSWDRLPLEAVEAFADYLFTVWAFRNVYLNIPDLLLPYYSTWTEANWVTQCGALKGHRFYAGEWIDEITLRLERNRWVTRTHGLGTN